MEYHLSQRSRELFDSGFYCAESVLQAITEWQGIQSDLIPRIATGFCSGISRTGGMCGAVSGAIMGLNLISGRSSPEASVEDSYVLVRALLNQFEQRFGSTNCRQLTGCDLSNSEGQITYNSNHLIEHCQQYVEGATSIAVSLIEERLSSHG